MAWTWWMALGAATLLALRVVVAKIRPARTCSWCGRMSGHEVTGHSYGRCQGPQRERRADEQFRAELERTRAKWRRERERDTARAAAQIALDTSKMRLIKVGTITTRSSRGALIVDISDWAFDNTSGPYSGFTPGGTQRTFNGTGAPEKFHGWTLPELHLIAHGGQCRCDVARLAKNTR
ncbi:hypothetical protein [Streptomyces sp. MP131-18]|uniref:hypothetical protein n=1 Tax=Streptomyces sp. MP131-18 TaxID=1857892 RepID=UPI0009D389EB|nr:hypothetical protein [Streptomyces sp. MP131-18]ONK09276.1 hypothetical protein STBA_71310 [Streptomyces sp. MP131-18]